MQDEKPQRFTIDMLNDTNNHEAWAAWGDYIDRRFADVTNWEALQPEQTLAGRVFDHALHRYLDGSDHEETAHHKAALAVSLLTELAAAGQAFAPGAMRIENMTTLPLHVAGEVGIDGVVRLTIFTDDARDIDGLHDRVEPFQVAKRLAALGEGYAFDLYQYFLRARANGRFEDPTGGMLRADSLFRTLVCDHKWGVARATDAFMWAMAIVEGNPMKDPE